MPVFDIELEDGRTVTLESDSDPTEEQVHAALGSYQSPTPDVPTSFAPESIPGYSILQPTPQPFQPPKAFHPLTNPGSGEDTGFTEATGGGLPGIIGGLGNLVLDPIGRATAAVLEEIRSGTPADRRQVAGITETPITAHTPLAPDILPGESERGVIPSLRRFAGGLLTPEGIGAAALAPLAPQAIAGTFLSQIPQGVSQSLQELATAETPAELRGAGTDVALQLLMGELMRRGSSPREAGKTQPTEGSNAIQQEAIRQVEAPAKVENVAPDVARNVEAQVPEVREIAPEITTFREDFESGKSINTNQAVAAGMKAKSVSDLEFLAETQRRRKSELEQLQKDYEADMENAALGDKMMASASTIQLPREAIEGATNVGSNAEGAMGIKFGERPMDWRTNPEVAEWLKKNAEDLNIVLPEELKSKSSSVNAQPKAEPSKAAGDQLTPVSGEQTPAAKPVESKQLVKARGNLSEIPPATGDLNSRLAKAVMNRAVPEEAFPRTGEPWPVVEVVKTTVLRGGGESTSYHPHITVRVNGKQIWRGTYYDFSSDNPIQALFGDRAVKFPSGKEKSTFYALRPQESAAGSRAFFPRESEMSGLGELSMPPTVEDVRASRPKATLDDIYKIFEPSKKVGTPLKQRAVNIVEAVRTGVSSKFRPVNKLAEDISNSYGAPKKDIAGIMEQLKGSQGKGEAQIYRFDRDVSSLVKGNEKDFNAYMFLRRSIDRLTQDAKDIAAAQAGATVPKLNRRAVAGYTINDLTPKLAALEAKLGPENLAKFRDAADGYQRYMDDALKLQVESGRMSQEVYDAIKDGNQFYAPFKVMKWIEETSQPSGSGRRIDTMADFTKAMTGIEDANFKLGDMLGAARQSILMSRVLADKNMAMRHVSELAPFDTNKQFIQKLADGSDAPKGWEAVNVLENGKQQRYAVKPEVAEAIQLYGPEGGGIVSRVLSAFSVPFRAGATMFNIPFQVSNLMADVPRQALVSKYGIRGVSDLVRYPLDFVQSLYSSIMGDVVGSKNKLFLDFLDSGVAGSTVQEFLTPDALRFKEPTNVSKSRKLAGTVLGAFPDFAKAIEQTSKIVGVKRAMRFEGVSSGAELAKQIPEAITELRRFSGSPDFGRMGKTVDQARLNLLYMFLNARIQGSIADIGRLTGRDGAKQAATTWFKVGTAVGIPTAYLYALNNRPEYKEDYAKRPKQEKDNYWLIPKDTFITTEDGEKIRDYWRIPKREIAKWVGNATESALKFAEERDPQAAGDFAKFLIQDISPVNITGDTAQQRIESVASSLNPVIKAPLEIATGRDMYRHRDLVPDQMKKASPENQFTERTATAFKQLATAMPDVAPEFLRSPIILENLTRNLTAGMITQFLPRKPVEGRTDIENAALLQRFQAMPLTDQEAFKDEMQQLERQAADEQLERHRKALKLIEDNKGSDLGTIGPKTEGDPKLLRHVVDLWIAKQNGATYQDRQLLALPAKQRAAYVANKLRGVTTEEKQRLLMEFSRKRILTEAVMQELPEAMK